MRKQFGTLYVLCAGVLWGFMGVFVNLLKSFGFSALQCTTIRIIVAAIVFLIFTLITDREKLKIRVCDLPLLAVTGLISITAMSVLYISAIDKTSLSTAAVLLYTSPVFVMIMSVLFLGERFTATKGVAVVCAFLGCFLVVGAKDARVTPLGLLVGIGAGITYASYSIFGTFALKKYKPLTVTTYAFLIGAVAMLVLGDIKGVEAVFAASQTPVKIVFAALGSGLVTAVLPFMFYTAGLKTVPADKAAIIACAEPLTASVLGLILYHEKLNYIGILLIVFAIVILQRKEKAMRK